MNLKNIINFFIILVMISSLNKAQTIDSLYEVATWQGFRSSAVSFTFDDNTPNQLAVALPLFDKYGFKMTFYPVINWGPNWAALQAAALNGHEIGSHTVSHPNLSSSTEEDEKNEYKNSQNTINSHVTGQKCITIAYPYCAIGNSELCNEYFIAARTCSGAIVPKTPSNFMDISSIVCGSEGSVQRSSDFVNKARLAESSNGWVVFLIHALDNETGYSPTSSNELDGALEYMNQNDNKYWVTSFGNVAKYIKERNSVSIEELAKSDTSISFTVSDTLDNDIYNIPVSVKRQLPIGWDSVEVSQNGLNLFLETIEVGLKKFIVIDVIPDGGEILITNQNITDVSEATNSIIQNFHLGQNYPNPFNPATTIDYRIPERSFVSLKIFDVLGRELTTLVNEQLVKGNYSVKFDGSKYNSGMYLYSLRADNNLVTKKLILLK